MLFLVAGLVFLIQFMVDKLMITYYYKERPQHNDFLNRSALRILKYGIAIFSFFGGIALTQNYCSLTSQPQSLLYTNEFLICRGFWKDPYLLIYCSIFVVFFLIISEIGLNRKRRESQLKEHLGSTDIVYFARLSELDRKCWIAEEHYKRERFGIQRLTDAQYEKLKKTRGQRFKIINDPFSYDILSNLDYSDKFQYLSPILPHRDEVALQVSVSAINVVYSGFSEQNPCLPDRVQYL